MNNEELKIKKVLKRHYFTELVELEIPIYGGKYAVITSGKAKTGLNLDSANDLFSILKKLQP